MNIPLGWPNFRAPANIMQFSHETNKLQNDGSIYYRNNYIKSENNARTYDQKTRPEKNTIFSTTASNFDNEETRRGFISQHTKTKGVIDDETLEMLRQITEIKKLLGQNQSSSGLFTGIGDISKQFIGRQISSELVALSLLHKNIVDNNRNIGFRGGLCYNCCSCWIDIVRNDKEEGMKSLLLQKPARHECDAKKVLEISKYNFQDITNKKNELYNRLSDIFTSIVSSIILFGQKPIHLNIEELNSPPPQQQETPPLNCPSFSSKSFQPQNQSLGNNKGTEKAEQNERQSSSWFREENYYVDLGNIEEVKKNHWAYRAIRGIGRRGEGKTSIIIEGSELADFFRTARATFGAFRVQMAEDGLAHYFFMYFSISN